MDSSKHYKKNFDKSNAFSMRSHNCSELRLNDAGKSVTLYGWVNRRRDHGNLIFVDLRDRFGITQIVFDPEIDTESHALAESIRSEYVLEISGLVRPRSEGMANPNMSTGEIEIEATKLTIASQAKTPPFSICDEKIDVNEELRLKYRYLDLRRGPLAANLELRHRVMMETRRFLDSYGFTEVSTPILCKSTPEGARDYLVPSRVHPRKFYALPQSPQQFKQLAMMGGLDRYFQIATCFRDEDLRADRQPEFTQIDIEMSFIEPGHIQDLIEEMMRHLFKSCLGVELPKKFPRYTHEECMEQYGTDRPDFRFEMRLNDVSQIVKDSEFTVFKDVLAAGGTVRALRVEGGAELSRREIDGYAEFVSQFGLKGLAWMKNTPEGFTSSIVKFFPSDVLEALGTKMEAEEGDLLLFAAADRETVLQALDHLRRKIAADRNLIDPNTFAFAWVVDFPLFEKSEEELTSVHHPFTRPLREDEKKLKSDPLAVRAAAYDIVCNGSEVGGGSIRIHNGEMQSEIFKLLNLSNEEIEEKFGFFIEALKYGTPPHGGIALGLDRLMMIMAAAESIRDVVAFPKTQKATDLMMDSPSEVSIEQLRELKITCDKS